MCSLVFVLINTPYNLLTSICVLVFHTFLHEKTYPYPEDKNTSNSYITNLVYFAIQENIIFMCYFDVSG